MTIKTSLQSLSNQIRVAEVQYDRKPGSVKLLAVSKKKSIAAIKEAIVAGQTRFGENYVQEAVEKINALGEGNEIEWHFIGPIQSNKTKLIAEYFSWVHSIDRIKIAKRLEEQRPAHIAPLNICLQINVDDEPNKSGFRFDELEEAANVLATYKRLRLRGLMAIPAPRSDFSAQYESFCRVKEAFEQLNKQGYALDTLSMGMSNDFEAAIAAGSTIIRIGTAIFGAREE